MENELIQALVTIVTFFNRTDRDKEFVKEAGVDLEATSFQLFVTVGRMQPTNISDLANVLGKSHSSVSRQIDKLEQKDLVVTEDGSQDARVRSIKLTDAGESLRGILDTTRLNKIEQVLSSWSKDEKATLLVSLKHLARTLEEIEQG